MRNIDGMHKNEKNINKRILRLVDGCDKVDLKEKIMEEKLSGTSLETQYPSMNLAYEFVKPSYDWLQNRLNAVNTRIEFLLTLSFSITVAIPIFMSALIDDIDFGAWWFVAIIVVFIIIALIGLVERMFGGIKLVSPQKLYDEWLELSAWEFKRSSIYWAGKNFQDNASLINRKANCGIAMTVLLVIEIIFILLWARLS